VFFARRRKDRSLVPFNPFSRPSRPISARISQVALRGVAMAIAMACALGGRERLWAEGGSFDDIRQDVRTPPPESGSPAPSKADDGTGPSSAADLPGRSLGAMFLLTCLEYATSPVLVPIGVLHDDYDQPVRFARFPYGDSDGYLLVGPEPVDLKELQEEPSKGDADQRAAEKELDLLAPEGFYCAGRLSGEYADNLDHLGQIGGELLLSTAGRLGMDTQWHYFNEQFPERGGDHLWLGDWNLVFRFAQSEHAEFRTGFGFNWLNTPADTNFGFNWTYGADFFPAKPWVLSTSFDLGRLGDAGLFHGRATVGVIVNRFEVYTGYDYFDLGRVGISSLVGGVRVWF
jgi:hypothetical protein